MIWYCTCHWMNVGHPDRCTFCGKPKATMEEVPHQGRVLENICYGSGRIAAESGDAVEIVSKMTTFWVYKEGLLIWTTQDLTWLWRHVVPAIPFESMLGRP